FYKKKKFFPPFFFFLGGGGGVVFVFCVFGGKNYFMWGKTIFSKIFFSIFYFFFVANLLIFFSFFLYCIYALLFSFFLCWFFFSAVGVQTIMIVASAFGEKVLDLGTTKLIATIICVQLVAIAGAKLMSVLTRYYGNIAILLVVIFLWGCICVAAYFLNSEWQFYILAFMVGLLMGGIQSLSRSTYSKLLPEDLEDTTAFFSFYDVTEK